MALLAVLTQPRPPRGPPRRSTISWLPRERSHSSYTQPFSPLVRLWVVTGSERMSWKYVSTQWPMETGFRGLKCANVLHSRFNTVFATLKMTLRTFSCWRRPRQRRVSLFWYIDLQGWLRDQIACRNDQPCIVQRSWRFNGSKSDRRNMS